MIETHGGAVVTGDVNAGTFIGRDQIVKIFNFISEEQLRKFFVEFGITAQIEQDVVVAIGNKVVDILHNSSSPVEKEQRLELVVDQALHSAVSVLDVESRIIYLLERIPTHNLISDSLFAAMEIIDLPVQFKYWIVQFADKDKLYKGILTIFRNSLDFTLMRNGIEAALRNSIDFEKLKSYSDAVQNLRMNYKVSSRQLQIELEAALKTSIDKRKLNSAIIEAVTAMLPIGEQGKQISELLRDTIIEAAAKLDKMPSKYKVD
jgi:sulfur transfer complex TusBCD TusB component (DsrH family)